MRGRAELATDEAGPGSPHGRRHVNTLKKRWEFQRAYRRGRKVWDGLYVVYVLPTPNTVVTDDGASRYGLTASRKVGDAVRRNRAKRLVREALRACERDLPAGLDIVVVARARAPHATYADTCDSIAGLLRRAKVLPADSPSAGVGASLRPEAGPRDAAR